MVLYLKKSTFLKFEYKKKYLLKKKLLDQYLYPEVFKKNKTQTSL
jgi:hypothetical protein